LLLATITSAAVFLIEGRTGFNLWDEGYLWYGVQRILAGEVPLRDFLSYDPARYYWPAGLLLASGTRGLVAVRAAGALFQVLGLGAGLALIARASAKRQLAVSALGAIAIAAWMAPRHRVYDASVSIALVGTLAALVQSPTRRRFFLTGAVIGVAAMFGRNHGVYGVAGSLYVMLWLWRTRRGEDDFAWTSLRRALPAWAGGIVVGYLPMLFSMALVPGFAGALRDDVVSEAGHANLALPVSWPWQPSFADTWTRAHSILVGAIFVAVLLFALHSLARIAVASRRRPASPVLVASSALALPYAHYAFSRADLEHLALGIFPLLIAAFAALGALRAGLRAPALVLLGAASVLAMLPLHDRWNCRAGQGCVEVEVGADRLLVTPGTAGDLALLERLANDFAPGDRSFLVAPIWPGAYAAFERRAPMWNTYPLYPASPEIERREIERIRAAAPGFVLLWDGALDGRDDRRFSNTHPLISRWVSEHFEPLIGYTTDTRFLLYRDLPVTP